MTIPDIVTRAKISQYLAVNAITKGGLNGGGIPSYLPELILEVRKNVEWMYAKDPSDPALVGIGNYLYAITGKFGLQASYLVNTGGSIAGVGVGTGAFRAPLIGVVGRGTIDDPTTGLTDFQSNKLIGLGRTNNNEIQIVIGVTIQWNFGDNKSFDFNSTTGTIYLGNGNTWIYGSGLYVDRNQ